MKIVKAYPPNYEEICNVIPGVRGNEGIVFTYGDTVYSPSTTDLVDHLHQHESVHVNQQKQMGRDEWWAKYLVDADFRLQQEVQAYRVQYNLVAKRRNWRNTEALLSSIARDLSGEMYGNMLTYEEARKLITKAKR